MNQTLGHYSIKKELGRGGMGVVYLARDTTLDRDVAIKVLSQPIADDDVMVQRFLREARSAAALTHPNIVQVYFIGKEGDKHYFVMEYVKGQTLTDVIKNEKRLVPDQAAQIILQAASGLAAAHDAGIFHRDIKPSNLILDENGLVKIADFGIAFKQETGQKLTATGQFLGTPGYLCPEICLGEPTDNKSDIFSLGIVFFEMLSGFSPFDADSPMAMMHKVVTAEVPDITKINASVNPELKMILKKMVEKDPQNRYQDCHQLQRDLEDFLGIERSKIGTSPYISKKDSEKTVSMNQPPSPPPVPVQQPVPLSPPVAPRLAPEQPPSASKSSTPFVVLSLAFVAVLLVAGFSFWYLTKNKKDDTAEMVTANSTEPRAGETLPSESVTAQTASILSDSDVDRVDQDLNSAGATDPSSLKSELDAFEEMKGETANPPTMQAGAVQRGKEPLSPAAGNEPQLAAPDLTVSSEDGEPAIVENTRPSKNQTQAEFSSSSGSPENQQYSAAASRPAMNSSLTETPSWKQWPDLFRVRPVTLPEKPVVMIQTGGDAMIAGALSDKLEALYVSRGYRIHRTRRRPAPAGTISPEGSIQQMLESNPDLSDLDLLVSVQVQPVSQMGIEYGTRYQTLGMQVNTISRIEAACFFPRQNRPGLIAWSKVANYNPDTALSEAGELADEMGKDWMELVGNGLESDKKPILLASEGDPLVNAFLLQFLEQELQNKGIPVLNLDAYGISSQEANLDYLARQQACGIITLNTTFLSEEEIAAYREITILSNFNVSLSLEDLSSHEILVKKTQNMKCAVMGMEGECRILAPELLKSMAPALDNLVQSKK
jgi:serine/threonine-protein kinase